MIVTETLCIWQILEMKAYNSLYESDSLLMIILKLHNVIDKFYKMKRKKTVPQSKYLSIYSYIVLYRFNQHV